jgi:RNA polymerase sigma-70 factor (ECF subfamily)
MSLDDGDQLLRRCQRGDEAALLEIVRRYQERIFRLAYRVLGDAVLAEEATASALVKVWSKSGQWRGQARAGTWIYRVAVRAVLDTRRGQVRWWRRWSSPLPPALVDLQPGPAEQALRQEEQEVSAARLLGALRQLSESDRVLIHLYYYESRPLAEIEAILGVARATLKMRLARARERLRGMLEGRDEST